MGWLHCEPDDLFIPKLFGMSDLTVYVPDRVTWLCLPLTDWLQAIADNFSMGDLSRYTFIARPIQVGFMLLLIVYPFSIVQEASSKSKLHCAIPSKIQLIQSWMGVLTVCKFK